MIQPIKVSRKSAKEILDLTFPEYKGHKVKVLFTEKVTFHNLNWDGGTRNEYKAVRSNEVRELKVLPPWDNPLEDMEVKLDEKTVIVEHSWFCGVDMGIRLHVHPSLAQKWLTSRVDK